MTVTETSHEEQRPDTVGDGGSSEPIRIRALIVGTGFSGIGAGIALQKMGVPFHILEKAGEMGGTWRDNTYPGAACDVPTHLYSFSFEPRSTWDRLFSQQPEIFDYLKEVGAKYGLYRHVTFNTRVTRGYWDEDEYRWHVFTDGDRSTSASSSSPGWVPCIFRAFRRSKAWIASRAPSFTPHSGITTTT